MVCREDDLHRLSVCAAPHPELKDVPFALDLIQNADDKLLVTAAAAPLGFGRPYAAPPGVPAERLATLRAEFAATFKDPQFQDDCKKQGIDCDDSRTGQQLHEQVRAAYAIPPEMKKRLVGMLK